MPASFHKVSQSTMRAAVANTIRNAILDGELQPGERLVERKLALQFGASLSVIREALVELETEGFLVKRRNTATYVTNITAEHTAKVFELRNVLESHAVVCAAERALPSDIEDLRAIHEEMCGRAKAGDCMGYLRADLRWHERLWRIADNEYLQASLERALVPLYAFFAIRSARISSFDLTEDAVAHLSILDALEKNDAVAAEAAVKSAMQRWRMTPLIYGQRMTAGT